jgi:hypothetical protein
MRQFFYLILTVSLLASCEEASITPERFPYVNTNEVSEIDTGGATFSASVLTSPSFIVDDYGFSWEGENNSTYQQSLKGRVSIGEFRQRIHSDIRAGKTYTCRAYVKGEGLTVLGNPVVFTGKGSRTPQVWSVSPLQAAPFSYIRVKGACLSRSRTDNLVSINGKACTVTFACEDSLIFRVPTLPLGTFNLVISHQYIPSFQYTSPFEISSTSSTQ